MPMNSQDDGDAALAVAVLIAFVALLLMAIA
jgi:hypothetical protein